MVLIKFFVKGQILQLDTHQKATITSDTLNYFKCKFDFDNTWDGFDVRVYFKNASFNITKSAVLDASGYCFIPWEVLAHTGVILCNVTGIKYVNGEPVRITAGPAKLFVHNSNPLNVFHQREEGTLEPDNQLEPTPTEYEQFIKNVSDYAKDANAAKIAAEAAEYKIRVLTVSASAGEPGSDPIVTKTEYSDHYNLDFLIPRGEQGETGNGIASISKTGSNGLVDTYTITYTNGNTATFTVTNGQDGHNPIITASKSGKTTSVFLDGTKIAEIDDGVGIDSIYKTGSSGLDPVVDEYTILYDDGNYTTFTVTNGKKGDKGDPQSPYTSTPNMDGVGSAGSSSNYSRGDHVHPSDTTKVDKVAGKGLSENDFTDSLKTKLDGIASGAEVNVQSDWNQSTNTADDYIKNKPDLSVYAPLASPSLTGTPTAPTATEGTNTTQIATTAFVKTADDAVKGMLKDALPTDTASGAIASFPDGSDLFDYLSCVVDIDPIQDLHGYDKPWVGGAGKNKLQTRGTTGTINGVTFTVNSDGSIKISGTATANARFNISHQMDTLPSGTYTLTGGKSANVYITLLTSEGSFPISGGVIDTGGGKSFTLASDLVNYSCRLMVLSGETVNTTIYPQIEIGSTATSWTPYENICPISGHDEVGASVVGFNQWDEEWELGGYNTTTGAKEDASSYFRCKNAIQVVPNTLYFYRSPIGGAFVLFYDADENYISYVNKGANTTFTTPSNCHYIRFRVYSYGATYKNDICINISDATKNGTYDPYNGTTYTTTLPSTTYGGTLDLVSGVLTVTYGYKLLNGSTTDEFRFTEVSTTTTADGTKYVAYIPSTYGGVKFSGVALADSYNFRDISTESLHVGEFNARGSYLRFVIADQTLDTLAKWNAYLANNPLQLCYELATPLTYQLTPTQIQTLLGQNNVWADCGDVEVQYKADVQMYIEKHITVYNGGVS